MIGNLIAIVLLVGVMLLTFVVVSAFLGFVITKVPFARTTRADMEYIVRQLHLKPADYVFDLGSGDGTVLFIFEELSGARTRGFELTWWTHLLAKIKKRVRRSRAELVNGNFMKQPWSEATVVYGYLYPFLMDSIEAKFLQDCRPGTVAVIRDFPFPNLKPDDVYFLPKGHEVYVYRKPGS